MTDDLAPVLSKLPEPMPASTLTATVMARIEREAERSAEAKVTVQVRRPREVRTWLWTFAGVALVLAAFANGWLSTGSLPDFTSPRVGRGGQSLIPVQGPATALLGVGLLVYLAGLFAPLLSDQSRR